MLMGRLPRGVILQENSRQSAKRPGVEVEISFTESSGGVKLFVGRKGIIF